MDVAQIKNKCIQKWEASDEELNFFNNNFQKWSEFLTEEEQKICFELLEKFDYYSKQHVNRNLSEMHKELTDIFKIDIEYTIFTILKDKNGRANSSLEYFLEYIHLNRINKYSKIEDINNIDEELFENIKNIVIIDDCIGSGKTFKKYLDKYKNRLVGKKVYYIIIHAVHDYADKVSNYANENGINVTIVCSNLKNKAFQESTESIKQKFKEISKRRDIPKDYILGEGKVEGLMSFYNGTPNNTLGIFWCKTKNNIPIFYRNNDEKPGWLKLKNKAKERNIQNYYNYGVKYE